MTGIVSVIEPSRSTSYNPRRRERPASDPSRARIGWRVRWAMVAGALVVAGCQNTDRDAFEPNPTIVWVDVDADIVEAHAAAIALVLEIDRIRQQGTEDELSILAQAAATSSALLRELDELGLDDEHLDSVITLITTSIQSRDWSSAHIVEVALSAADNDVSGAAGDKAIRLHRAFEASYGL
jgi:hypothetical protein